MVIFKLSLLCFIKENRQDIKEASVSSDTVFRHTYFYYFQDINLYYIGIQIGTGLSYLHFPKKLYRKHTKLLFH